MSEWKQDAAKRRDERNVKHCDDASAVHRHKYKKRWCGGKVGKEHDCECLVYTSVKNGWWAHFSWGRESSAHRWRVLVCKKCGKELVMWYGNNKDKPAWVDK